MYADSERRVGNRILGRLGDQVGPELLAAARAIWLPANTGVQSVGETATEIYFPVSTTLSVIVDLPEGQGAEVAVIGSEGLLGIFPILGVTSAPIRAITRRPGEALVLPVAPLRRAFDASQHVRAVLCTYAAELLTQMSIIVACTAHHDSRQRVARWLLSTGNGADMLEVTHDGLAEALGLHRPTVSTAVEWLRDQGAIQVQRGRIAIRNRESLKQYSCDCYQGLLSSRGLAG